MSASSPVRQMRLCTYESSTLRSSDSCGSSLVACFCRILPMLLAAEPSIARPTAKLCDASAADGNSVAGVGVDGTAYPSEEVAAASMAQARRWTGEKVDSAPDKAQGLELA